MEVVLVAIKYVDSVNVISEDPVPDNLRAELGYYWEVTEQGALSETDRLKSNKLDESKTDFSKAVINREILFPEITQKISIVGHEAEFRDHIQWREYLANTIKQTANYTDHYFQMNSNENFFYNMLKNFHHPKYEDATKTYESNQLIKLNIINYENNSNELTSQFIKNAAGILTEYDTDEVSAIPNSSDDILKLYNEYEGRIENYNASLSELNVKQRNVFILEKDRHVGIHTALATVPYSLHLFYGREGAVPMPILNETKQTKYLLQSIKRNEAYLQRKFYANQNEVSVKLHDMINLILNYDASTFSEERDEVFLLEEDDLDSSLISNRFVNQIRKVNMLEDLQKIIAPPQWFYEHNLRNYQKTINIGQGTDCKDFILGYKIEKFLDNDATLPVQTYYISASDDELSGYFNLLDTQLKFGREYIYKIKELVMVLGSSYSYSNLIYSNESGIMERPDGTLVESGEPAVVFTSTDKYKAQVEVKIRPSFQIVELEVKQFRTMFFDECPPVPEPIFYNESGKKNSLKIYFQSNLNELYDREEQFVPLTDTDSTIQRNLQLSADSIYATTFSKKYAIGAFEIYRMDSKPTRLEDFAANYLTTVDMRNNWLWHDSEDFENTGVISSYTFDTENLDAFYEDNIVTHQKYYYLFRALTYHNTPSNPTVIYEVELIQDSDETKAVVGLFQFNSDTSYQYNKKMKRILKISPNLNQLEFNEEDNTIGVLRNKLVLGANAEKKFKIRITSKHTGKKMDVNITVKLNDET